MRHDCPARADTKINTKNHGDPGFLRRRGGDRQPTFWDRPRSRTGRKRSLGLILILLGFASGATRIRAAAISAMPSFLPALIGGHSKSKARVKKKSPAETAQKKSFREMFKKRGADIDNFVYQGSDPATPKSDPAIPKPAPGPHSEKTSVVGNVGAHSC